MKNLINSGFAILALTIIMGSSSCTKSEANLDTLGSDADLITAIENAINKEAIDESLLPTQTKTTLQNEYYESYTEQANMAENLGYEVMLRVKKGSMAGEQTKTYFNMEGKELDPDSGDKTMSQERKRERAKERARMREMMRDCFNFEFPVSFTMADESVITIEDDESWDLIKEWHIANPDVKERGKLIFPVVIYFDEDTSLTINSEEEMQVVREDCQAAFEKEKEKQRQKEVKKCFDLVFPVTFIMPDASEIFVETADQRVLVKEWYEANPDVEEKAALKFPVDVVFEDGTTLTVNSKEEMQELRHECNDANACVKLVYPITLIMPDASEIVIEERGARDEVKAWYEANPDVEEKPSLLFPVEVELQDGSIITVNSKEELKELKDACSEEKDDKSGNGNGKQGK